MHLILDGLGGDEAKLGDEAVVSSFLDRYPAKIGMTKISSPHVYTYRGAKAEDWGVSGFVLIAESHISIHTFPFRGYINVDIFSCKEFDAPGAAEDVAAAFGLAHVQTCLLRRGLDNLGEEAGLEAAPLGRPSGSS